MRPLTLRWQDSNLRPSQDLWDSLPTELHRHVRPDLFSVLGLTRSGHLTGAVVGGCGVEPHFILAHAMVVPSAHIFRPPRRGNPPGSTSRLSGPPAVLWGGWVEPAFCGQRLPHAPPGPRFLHLHEKNNLHSRSCGWCPVLVTSRCRLSSRGWSG